jgi:hypothetical protein
MGWLCVSLAAGAFAQTEQAPKDPYAEWPNTLGFFVMNIGNMSFSAYGDPKLVYGLQYARWFDRVGFQITGGGIYVPGKSLATLDVLDYSIALQGMLTVYGKAFSDDVAGRLYLWGMVGHHGWIYPKSVETTSPEGVTTYNTESTGFVPGIIGGLGLGIDVTLLQHLSIPLEFGYTAQFINNITAGPSVGVGLRYRF